jgi:hypothetical protein
MLGPVATSAVAPGRVQPTNNQPSVAAGRCWRGRGGPRTDPAALFYTMRRVRQGRKRKTFPLSRPPARGQSRNDARAGGARAAHRHRRCDHHACGRADGRAGGGARRRALMVMDVRSRNTLARVLLFPPRLVACSLCLCCVSRPRAPTLTLLGHGGPASAAARSTTPSSGLCVSL